MKAKVLTRVNAMIAFILTALGFGSCDPLQKYGIPEPMAEYGCPHATFEAKGTVTNEESEPVQNIRVRVKGIYTDYAPEAYTDENGHYLIDGIDLFPTDSVDVVATDTAGVYAADSVRLKIEYDRSNVDPDDHWNEGDGLVQHDFQLKKQD